jgi:hypothetical protein
MRCNNNNNNDIQITISSISRHRAIIPKRRDISARRIISIRIKISIVVFYDGHAGTEAFCITSPDLWRRRANMAVYMYTCVYNVSGDRKNFSLDAF